MATIESTNGGLRELALFAGAGGGILGGKLLGWRTVCAVEWDAYAASVLVARQNDGCLPPFPIWDDVQTFDGKPWRGRVDVVSGGFPCQDISAAGKGAGIEGERSGMWKHMARIIGEVRPRFAFVENSPMLVGRGLAVVLGDLAAMGYDARWGIVGANHAGAPHKRDRIWIVADSMPTGQWREQREEKAESDALADSASQRQPRQGQHWFGCDPAEKGEGETDYAFAKRIGHICGIESPVGRVAHGVASRVDKLRCLGNGQVPAVVRLAWETMTKDQP
jgi:DNA (cytosine-5)-methyltransferase 1